MKKYIAELIATFALVFCGTGAVIINETTHGSVGGVGIAIAFGFIILSMIYAVGDISGAHMNPAVTIGFAVSGKFPIKEVFPYVCSQVAGALLASLLLKFLYPPNILLGTTLPAGDAMQSFVMEIVLTFFLMFTVIHVATGSKETGTMAGLAIGAVITLEAAFAGPISGASMNPARSLAPALVSGHFEFLWIYLTAPVIGAIIAVLAYRLLKILK